VQYHGADFEFFHWTGENRFIMNGTKDFISLGGGEYA
jgi:hypothetical protein